MLVTSAGRMVKWFIPSFVWLIDTSRINRKQAFQNVLKASCRGETECFCWPDPQIEESLDHIVVAILGCDIECLAHVAGKLPGGRFDADVMTNKFFKLKGTNNFDSTVHSYAVALE